MVAVAAVLAVAETPGVMGDTVSTGEADLVGREPDGAAPVGPTWPQPATTSTSERVAWRSEAAHGGRAAGRRNRISGVCHAWIAVAPSGSARDQPPRPRLRGPASAAPPPRQPRPPAQTLPRHRLRPGGGCVMLQEQRALMVRFEHNRSEARSAPRRGARAGTPSQEPGRPARMGTPQRGQPAPGSIGRNRASMEQQRPAPGLHDARRPSPLPPAKPRGIAPDGTLATDATLPIGPDAGSAGPSVPAGGRRREPAARLGAGPHRRAAWLVSHPRSPDRRAPPWPPGRGRPDRRRQCPERRVRGGRRVRPDGGGSGTLVEPVRRGLPAVPPALPPRAVAGIPAARPRHDSSHGADRGGRAGDG